MNDISTLAEPQTDEIEYNAALEALKASPKGADALYSLEVIDTKTSPLVSFIGILLAGILVFSGKDSPWDTLDLGIFSLSQAYFVAAALSTLLLAAMLSIFNLNIFIFGKIVRRCKSTEAIIERIHNISLRRQLAHKASLYLTFFATIATSIAVALGSF